MTHDLIRDNLEDLGLDQYAAVDDKKPPELYPATKLPGIPPLFDEDVSTTHKTMYLLHRFRASQDYMGSLTDKNVYVRRAPVSSVQQLTPRVFSTEKDPTSSSPSGQRICHMNFSHLRRRPQQQQERNARKTR